MPFNNYSSRRAKSIFKSSPAPSKLSTQSTSRNTTSQETDPKPSPLSKSLKANLERTRALVDSIKKEKYNSDLELSRLGGKDAARARIEAAQRASLDDALREDALEELRKQEYPQVVEKLNSDLEPQVRAELLARLWPELRPKVHAELRDELMGDLTDVVRSELKGNQELRDEAIQELKDELRQELDPVIREELYPQVIADMKEEYKFMVLEQLKGELAVEAASQTNGLNGHHHEIALETVSRSDSEASDFIHASSELATRAKRRHSDTFQGEDPDIRRKRLKMINLNGEPPVKAGSLPPFGTFAPYPDFGINAAEDSLEEGEKADVEDEMDDEEQPTIEDNGLILDEPAGDPDKTLMPDDTDIVGINGVPHSTQLDQQQSDEDADAELEDPVPPDHNQDTEIFALDPQLQDLQILNTSTLEDDKTDPPSPIPEPHLQELDLIPPSSPDLLDIVEAPSITTHETIKEVQINIKPAVTFSSFRPANISAGTSPYPADLHTYTQPTALPTEYQQQQNKQEAEEEESSTYSDSEDSSEYRHAPRNYSTAPPYLYSERYGNGNDSEEDDDEGEDEDEDEDKAEDEDEVEYRYLSDEQFAAEEVYPLPEAEDEEEDGESEDDGDESGGEEVEEEGEEGEVGFSAMDSVYQSAGGNENEPIELDSD